MNVPELLRVARLRGGLTQAALAERAGTSQPTLAAYEAGRAEPRLETLERLARACDFELVVTMRPKVRRGAEPMAEVAKDVAALLADEGSSSAWRRLLDFVDDFRESSVPGRRWLVEDPPPSTGDGRFDAALAALVEFLCTEASTSFPSWTDEPERFAEPWWFVSGMRGFEAMAFRDSPIAFARHGVFVNDGAFDRV